MPKLNPDYRPEAERHPATPLERPLPRDYDYDTRKWADAYHLWRAKQPDATAWEKVVGYCLPLAFDQVAGRLTPGDVERLYRTNPIKPTGESH